MDRLRGDLSTISITEVFILLFIGTATVFSAEPTSKPEQGPIVTEAERQHWAFRPLLRPLAPTVTSDGSEWRSSSNSIDAFLQTRLHQAGIDYSKAADRVTFIRRASLDLLGLPPTPNEVDAFLSDEAPDAVERLVQRLLDSPHFGERWGRHWLDIAGYVDTVGFDVDANNIITSEGKWHYRDYVIDSFNRDKPFNQFVTEQLAGDELVDWRNAERFTPEIRERLIATGFLRTARDLTHEEVGVIPQNFFGIVDDTLEIVGTGLLGLTLQCAKCHTHKFDPIPQEDYYRLASLFTPAYNPLDWRPVIAYDNKVRDRGLPDVSPREQAEIERRNQEISEHVASYRRQQDELRKLRLEKLKEARLATLPEAIRADLQAAIATNPEERDQIQKYLVEKLASTLNVSIEQVEASLTAEEQAVIKELESRIITVAANTRVWRKIQALVELGPPPATHLLDRGDYQTPAQEVTPGFLRVLCNEDSLANANVKSPFEGTSGRRLALAKWMTDPQSPAAAALVRVYVNRVWSKLFGRGIVVTVDNFGVQGMPPTHPELLEWLSADFVDSGWSVKSLVRRIVLSSAYQQSSQPAAKDAGLPDPATIDPGNELLWRMPLKRLESESVRDALLSVCGQLNTELGGPPVLTDAQPDGSVIIDRKKLSHRGNEFKRSIYLLSRRAYNLSLLNVFDQPQVATNCIARNASAVPLQSLTMLNDDFFHQGAISLAHQLSIWDNISNEDRFVRAFRRVLVRIPDDLEVSWCRSYLNQQIERHRAAGQDDTRSIDSAWVQLCHTLLNTSEFLYVE